MRRFLLIIFSTAVFCFLIRPLAIAQDKIEFITQEFAPFSYTQNSYTQNEKVSGPAVEVIRIVCDEMGVACEFRSTVWAGAQDAVKNGLYDGIFLIGYNKPRAAYLYFSYPIVETEYGFFTNKDNPKKFKTPADFIGYTIGVYGPSNTSYSLEKVANKVGGITIDLTPKDESAFKKLNAGRVDGVYSNRDVGYELIDSLKLENIHYSYSHRKLYYYIGFSKKTMDKSLMEKFNKTYKKLFDKGIISRILESYNLTPVDIKAKSFQGFSPQ